MAGPRPVDGGDAIMGLASNATKEVAETSASVATTKSTSMSC